VSRSRACRLRRRFTPRDLNALHITFGTTARRGTFITSGGRS
jgi:hypothetical protein